MTKLNKAVCFLVLMIVFAGTARHSTAQGGVHKIATGTVYEVALDTIRLTDLSRRNREVPLAIYKPKHYGTKAQQVVILNHGYGNNHPHSYLAYSYLANFLASKGFFVASIQHELPGDSLIPADGIPQIVRRPFWDRGADNILFVINELKKSHPALDFKNITLVGHSNGGDMVALFPQKYPNTVRRIITLDNRRMALPRTANPRVYSLRSSDQPADAGVLYTDEEQKQLGATVIKLANTTHNDMSDLGTREQQAEINNYILSFLTEDRK